MELDYFLWKLKEYRKNDKDVFVCFCHNLSYEFTYLSGRYRFESEDVFAVNTRMPVRAMLEGFIEFRCSYIHSNMSLDEYTHKMGAEHRKLSGIDYDYSKLRWFDTPLTIFELEYSVNDVLGLCEAIKIDMDSEKDNLYTFPLTSTGYVRRDVKNVVNNECWWLREIKIPDLHLCELLRKGFRGGNTHASRFFSGRIIKGPVHNIDIASAYPDAMCNQKYPLTTFRRLQEDYYNMKELLKIRSKGKALLIDFSVDDLRILPNVPVPCLSFSKCEDIDILDIETDNGRVLNCRHIRTVMTDVDFFDIFLYQYDGYITYNEIYVATYKYLPTPVRNQVIKYFKNKTKYKKAKGAEAVYYTKEKNKLNSIYGMSAQSVLIISSIFDPDAEDSQWEYKYQKSQDDMLNEYNKKVFFPYQISLWVTAYTRKKLQDGIDTVGADKFIYCDTDSVKYVGDVDISELNEAYKSISDEHGAYCDHDGKRYYMGIFDREMDFDSFKTLGSKKYIYTIAGCDRIYCTIAGVRKNTKRNSKGKIIEMGGGDELMLKGGMDAFSPGFIFTEAGGSDIKYNELKEPIIYQREDGTEIEITSNATIYNGEYTVKMAPDYAKLLESEVVQKAFEKFINMLEVAI